MPSSSCKIVALIFHSPTVFWEIIDKTPRSEANLRPPLCVWTVQRRDAKVHRCLTDARDVKRAKYPACAEELQQAAANESRRSSAAVCSSSLNPLLSCISLLGGGTMIHFLSEFVGIHTSSSAFVTPSSLLNYNTTICFQWRILVYLSAVFFSISTSFSSCESQHKPLGSLMYRVTSLWFSWQNVVCGPDGPF